MHYIKRHSEFIRCPGCGEIEHATIEARVLDFGGMAMLEPFDTYVHECRCGYVILESEWDTVERCPDCDITPEVCPHGVRAVAEGDVGGES